MPSFLENWPLWLRIVAGLFAGGVLLVVGVMVFFWIAMWRYTRDEEETLAEVRCGPNALMLKRIKHITVGNTSTSFRLFWNEKQVADTDDTDAAGQLALGLPADPDDRRGLVVRSVGTGGWTVWVASATFPRADFDALADCLTGQRSTLEQQIRQRYAEDPMDKVMGTVPYIGQAIYGKREAAPERVYVWNQGKSDAGNVAGGFLQKLFGNGNSADERTKMQLRVQPNGSVMLRHDEYVVEPFGELSIEKGQRVITWRYPKQTLLLSRDLPQFNDKSGQSVTERYVFRHAPDDNVVFYRLNGDQTEMLYVNGADNNTGQRDVERLLFSGPARMLHTVYSAGRILPDSTGRPVFAWQPQPDHPLTESDLGQFRNEAGQPLTAFFTLRKSDTP